MYFWMSYATFSFKQFWWLNVNYIFLPFLWYFVSFICIIQRINGLFFRLGSIKKSKRLSKSFPMINFAPALATNVRAFGINLLSTSNLDLQKVYPSKSTGRLLTLNRFLIFWKRPNKHTSYCRIICILSYPMMVTGTLKKEKLS